MKRTHVLVAVLAALLLLPALAEAARGGARATPEQILHSPKLLARYLDLSASQVTQSEALFSTLGASLKTIREQEKVVRDQLAAELAKPSPDGCAVGGFVLRLDGFHGQVEAALSTFDTAFSAILTAEQLAKYNALKELAGIGRGGRR